MPAAGHLLQDLLELLNLHSGYRPVRRAQRVRTNDSRIFLPASVPFTARGVNVEWEGGRRELERRGVENCPGHNCPMTFKTLLILIQFLLAGANSNPNYLYLNCIDQIKERQLHSGYRWSALAALGEPADCYL